MLLLHWLRPTDASPSCCRSSVGSREEGNQGGQVSLHLYRREAGPLHCTVLCTALKSLLYRARPRTAVQYTTMRRNVPHYNAPQWTAIHYTTLNRLQCTTLHCIRMYYTTLHQNVLHYTVPSLQLL